MRIGELADLMGITTRTVRYYHKLGVLPEPERQANGYRDYSLRDAVVLARVRRLTEVGLSLEEVREAVAEDSAADLRTLLTNLDADLSRQEEEIRRRRARLAGLLRQEILNPDTAIATDLTALLATLPPTTTGVLAREREWLTLFSGSVPEPFQDELRSLSEDPAHQSRVRDFYSAMDELEDAAPDDPRIPALARDLAAGLPRRLLDLLPRNAPLPADAPDFLAELSPAQAEVVRQAFTLLSTPD